MNKRALALAIATLLSVASISAAADAADPQTTESRSGVPARSASMQAVAQQFGQPLRTLAPVGDPPISRWIYGEFTVYFERQRVVHTVAASLLP